MTHLHGDEVVGVDLALVDVVGQSVQIEHLKIQRKPAAECIRQKALQSIDSPQLLGKIAGSIKR